VSDRADIAAPDGDAAAVVAVARAGEPDRYLAALLAPPPQRGALLALAAFAAELARIPRLVVREPLMGEVRLQWWRDALELAEGQRAGHRVADAVRVAARNYELPPALLDGLIDARGLELRGDSFADDQVLHDFLWKTEGALFALACRVIGLAAGRDVDSACTASAQAYGIARLLLGLPRSLVLGRIPLPRAQIAAAGLTAEELLAGTAEFETTRLLTLYHAQIRGSFASAHRFAAQLPRRQRVAFLPLALVGPYVRALERQGSAALREEVRVAPLTRVRRIAAAHLFGRL
jgi:phytoene synthase